MELGSVQKIEITNDAGRLLRSDGSTIQFSEPNLDPEIQEGSIVSFDVNNQGDTDTSNDVAINLQLVLQTVAKFTEITSDVVGDQVVDQGELLVVKNGATISGNVSVEGGVLSLTASSKVTGNVDGDSDGTVYVESNSEISGNADIKNAKDLIINTGTVGGDVDIKNSRSIISNNGNIGGILDVKNITQNVVIETSAIGGDVDIKNLTTATLTNNTSIGGDVDIKNCSNVSVTGNSITGYLEIKNIDGTCNEANNIVGGTNSGCP